MEKIIKLIKKYLGWYYLETFKSIVFQKDGDMNEWYHIFITKEFATGEEETCDILIARYGVIRINGYVNYQVIRLCHAIDYLCDPVIFASEHNTLINECNDVITSTIESENKCNEY